MNVLGHSFNTVPSMSCSDITSMSDSVCVHQCTAFCAVNVIFRLRMFKLSQFALLDTFTAASELPLHHLVTTRITLSRQTDRLHSKLFSELCSFLPFFQCNLTFILVLSNFAILCLSAGFTVIFQITPYMRHNYF